MIQLTKIEDLIGKRIVNVTFHDKYSVLFFENDEIALISIDQGWEPEDRELTLLLEVGVLEPYEKRDLKLITETEYNATVYEYQERCKKERDENERRAYEMLKKKFENA